MRFQNEITGDINDVLSDNDLVKGIAAGVQDMEEGNTIPFKAVQEICKLREELAALKEQHSADLREIAEMAIARESDYWRAFQGYWDYGLPKPTEITADSIVREFRKQKEQK